MTMSCEGVSHVQLLKFQFVVVGILLFGLKKVGLPNIALQREIQCFVQTLAYLFASVTHRATRVKNRGWDLSWIQYYFVVRFKVLDPSHFFENWISCGILRLTLEFEVLGAQTTQMRCEKPPSFCFQFLKLFQLWIGFFLVLATRLEATNIYLCDCQHQWKNLHWLFMRAVKQ